ncbi:type VII secretion system-associated protein [Streptomyces mirabilis]
MSFDTLGSPAADAEAEPGDAVDEPGPPSVYSVLDQAAPENFRRRFAPPPEPTESLRATAALAPDHWLGMVDPAWQGDGPPPSWALIGRWRSGPTGEIEEWQDNGDYRPSPEALGWPEATDLVDAAVQLASTGYGPAEDVARNLAAAEVAVLVNHDDIPLTAAAPDGTSVLPIYTSLTHVQAAGRLAYQLVTVADLVERLPEGHLLYVNPTGSVSMLVETEPLLEALATRDQASAANPAELKRDGTSGALADAPAESADHRPQMVHSETTEALGAADIPGVGHGHTIPGMEPEGQAESS